jgi:hypothetical protein
MIRKRLIDEYKAYRSSADGRRSSLRARLRTCFAISRRDHSRSLEHHVIVRRHRFSHHRAGILWTGKCKESPIGEEILTRGIISEPISLSIVLIKGCKNMYCASCGVALSHELSYCNRCGANLSPVAIKIRSELFKYPEFSETRKMRISEGERCE